MPVVVAPASVGKIHEGDVLIDNFNNLSNLQGTGTTIVDFNPSTRKTTTFAKIPQHMPQCPGGIGLTAAMTMLKSGWIIVGSTPSTDGTTRTKGPGALLVIVRQRPVGRRMDWSEHRRSLGKHRHHRSRKRRHHFCQHVRF